MITKRCLLAALVVILLAAVPAIGPASPARGRADDRPVRRPANFDPYNTTAPYISVFAQICEPLIYWDSDASGNAVIKKLLATDYRWLDDTGSSSSCARCRFSNGEPFNARSSA